MQQLVAENQAKLCGLCKEIFLENNPPLRDECSRVHRRAAAESRREELAPVRGQLGKKV
jgi:hypothetical protein